MNIQEPLNIFRISTIVDESSTACAINLYKNLRISTIVD